MITKTPTLNMTHEQWLEARSHSIGGSDAGSVLGLNDYCSPYSLWAEKTGKYIPEDISDKEAVRLGTDLEDYVAQRWCEATGKKVRRDNHIYHNSDYPFAHANIDRAVVGEKAGLECKTTSNWDVIKQCQDGKYPDSWYCQMNHYMMVTGLPKWYLAVICFGRGFYMFEVERDEAEIKALAAAESDFWQHVTSNTPVPVDGTESTSEALKMVLGNSLPGSAVGLDAVRSNLQMLEGLENQIKQLTKQRDEQKAIIESFMGEAESGTCEGYKVSFKSGVRNTFDKARYEKDHGKFPAEYNKVTNTRTFRWSATDKEEK